MEHCAAINCDDSSKGSASFEFTVRFDNDKCWQYLLRHQAFGDDVVMRVFGDQKAMENVTFNVDSEESLSIYEAVRQYLGLLVLTM